MAALPVLVGEADSIIIDQFAHASLHSGLHLLPHVPQRIVRHNRMDQLDSPRIAVAVAMSMQERGYYCCLCTFPAVPMHKPGLRFTICRHIELADIEAFVSALNESVQLANRQAGE